MQCLFYVVQSRNSVESVCAEAAILSPSALDSELSVRRTTSPSLDMLAIGVAAIGHRSGSGGSLWFWFYTFAVA